jgi:choline dehydrogenase-like flavoprotein
MRDEADVIVVGSGAAAVSAAWPLVTTGRRVVMVDAGVQDQRYEAQVPPTAWSRIRRTDPGQHRYFLGEGFEGVPVGASRVGSQLTPPRAYVTARTGELTPRHDRGFVGLESLATGGLASAWGAAVLPWVEEDFAGLPVTLGEMKPHYDAVAELMGVCGGAGDDLSAVFHDPAGMMPAAGVDSASMRILERYERGRSGIVASGLRLGRARLAAATTVHRGRGPLTANDMDFWCDHGRGVYRPRWTLEEMLGRENFSYRPGVLVHAFARGNDGRLIVRGTDTTAGGVVELAGRRVIVAAGALGTARIVLRSLGRLGVPVPLVTNHSPYYATLNLGMIGRRAEDARHSLTQLTGFYRGTPGSAKVQVYSYRSLLTHKLLKETPLAMGPARRALRATIPMLSIWGVHHPDEPGRGKDLVLEAAPAAGPGLPADRLRTRYAQSEAERDRQARVEGELRTLMWRLGCVPLKRVDLGFGASIHYAGMFPMAARPGDLGTDASGKLAGWDGVHLADGSVFPRLPAQGLTFTMMANAHRIGGLVSGRL